MPALFYISWGKKTYERPEGVAADFCGICRRPTAIEVRQIRSQDHVYNIGLGPGHVVGRSCRCLTCGSEWAMQVGTVTTSLNSPSPLPLQTLISETFPRLPLIYGERLEQEAAIARDPFSLGDKARISLLAEPFFILDNDMRRDEKRSNGLRAGGTLGCIGAVGLLVAAVTLFASGKAILGVLLLLGVAGFTWLTMRLYGLETERYMAQRIYPRLASSLAPLLPSSSEVEQIVNGIRSQSPCASDTKVKKFLPVLLAASSPIEEAHSERQKQAAR